MFNKPNGEDVYAGCNIDYSGKYVTPANFLAIIQGEASKVTGGNGKVLKSDKNSKVFINFADHGAPGLIGFPTEYLYADDFNTAIKNMHSLGLYDELVIYIEACESGSMFDGLLPTNINAYATTAANDSESSWGTYCPPDDYVNGKPINSCLGDLYSVNWMEDSDANNLNKETLGTQFATVKKETTKSHVQEFGDLTIQDHYVGEFQGVDDVSSMNSPDSLFQMLKGRAIEQNEATHNKHMSAVSSRDAEINHLYAKVMRESGHKSHLDLAEELNSRMRVDHVFADFFEGEISDDQSFPLPRDFTCLRTMMNTYADACGEPLTDYGLKYVKYFVKSCQESNSTQEYLVERLQAACTH